MAFRTREYFIRCQMSLLYFMMCGIGIGVECNALRLVYKRILNVGVSLVGEQIGEDEFYL